MEAFVFIPRNKCPLQLFQIGSNFKEHSFINQTIFMKRLSPFVTAIAITVFICSCCGSNTVLRTSISVVADGSRKDSAWLFLPKKYYCESHSSASFPLLVFFHGGGGSSSVGTHNLTQMVNDGWGTPAVLIQDKNNKDRFTFPAGNYNNQFIILCPQHSTGWRPADEVKVLLDTMLVRYRVDPSRIYLTGFSMGGFVVYNFLRSSSANASRIAAAVPMSAWGIDVVADVHADIIAGAHTPVWGFCGTGDSKYDVNNGFIDAINAIQPGLARFTSYPGDHCCWQAPYDTTHTYYNPNIYEWMLSHHR